MQMANENATTFIHGRGMMDDDDILYLKVRDVLMDMS
jgi:hypothetical protein